MNATILKIKKDNVFDFKLLAELDRKVLPDSYWSYEDWIALDLTRFGLFCILQDKRLVGFLLFEEVDPESEAHWYNLLKIGIELDSRKQGLGGRLIQELHVVAFEKLIDRIVLEVRKSNLGAQHLYLSKGYKMLHHSKSYYSDGEDALIFQYKIIH